MKLLYCMLGLSMAACTPQKTVNGGEDELSMLIGTYLSLIHISEPTRH